MSAPVAWQLDLLVDPATKEALLYSTALHEGYQSCARRPPPADRLLGFVMVYH